MRESLTIREDFELKLRAGCVVEFPFSDIVDQIVRLQMHDCGVDGKTDLCVDVATDFVALQFGGVVGRLGVVTRLLAGLLL